VADDYTYVNFGGMQNGQANFLAALKNFQNALQTLDNNVRTTLADWDGDARTAYESKKREWEAAAQKMATVVQGMGGAIGDSHDIHRTAENQNTALWT
jgi:ESAT-6 family protein